MVLYRSRLGDNLDDVTLDYVSSLVDDRQIITYDILGSEAHVIMLYEQKIITKNDLKKILLALEILKKEKFDRVSDSEDIHELIETLVIKQAGMRSGGKMHTARSRNDQVVLDIRMKIRDDINLILNCILDLIEALVSIAKIHQRTVMPLYTHLQQAQAGVLSHYLLANSDVLFRDFDRLKMTYLRVNQCPLGAGPIGGTSIPIDRLSTARMLGFESVLENSIDATSSRDFAIEYVSNLAILMTNLSRIAEDFVIWSSTEFAFIELADRFASPSSVMPQKKNPDIMELTRGKTAQVIGNLTSILVTIKGLATGYGRDLQQIKSSIWSSSHTCRSALIIIREVVFTLKINETNMKKATEKSYLIALDIAENLVKKGIPFRETHRIAGNLVQIASHLGKPLSKLSLSEIKSCIGNTKVDSKLLSTLISSTTTHSSLLARTSFGSSGFDEQKRMVENRLKKINHYRIECQKQQNQISKAFDELSKKIKSVI